MRLAAAVVVVAAAVAGCSSQERTYVMPSSSMEPTIHCARPAQGCLAPHADHVRAHVLSHGDVVRRGEIVVFQTPPAAKIRCGAGGTFVKRIIGLPGDELKENSGYLYVRRRGTKWRKLIESYVKPDRRAADHTPPSVWPGPGEYLKPSQYFMVGDNRGSSCDSRVWGAVPRKNLIGPVFAIYWPPNRISFR